MDNEELLFRLRAEKEEALKVHADLAYSLGIYFGYPACCRYEFCEDLINGKSPSDRNIDGSGFIPCRKHFLDIKAGDVKLADLIQDRISTKPFK